MKKERFNKKVGNTYILMGLLLCFIALILLAYPQLPFILNLLAINTPEQEQENIALPIYEEEIKEVVKEESKEITLPSKDLSLPSDRMVVIPSIGVDAVIQEGEDSTKALANGPWIVPDYATPESRFLNQTTRSIIIASHRYGYSSWGEDRRYKLAFLKLPDTKIGDLIVLVWDQREYVYRIIDTDTDTYIKPEYDSDLIVYTCQYYNSPLRIFRFADLISINSVPISEL